MLCLKVLGRKLTRRCFHRIFIVSKFSQTNVLARPGFLTLRDAVRVAGAKLTVLDTTLFNTAWNSRDDQWEMLHRMADACPGLGELTVDVTHFLGKGELMTGRRSRFSRRLGSGLRCSLLDLQNELVAT